MRHLAVITLLIVCAAAIPIYAQPDDLAARVDAYVAQQMETLAIPGMAVAIVQNDAITYMQGYGTADAAARPVTPQTPFWLASVSKSFAGTALMQLVEGGQIDLDAPVSTYIPWFREGMNDPVPIRVRDLVYQTSGFSTYSGREMITNQDTADDALERNVRRLSSAPLEFTPGDGWEYSNSNFDVLGYVIQVVVGQPYETVIEQNIFAPLAMTNSYTTLAAAQAHGMTEGYYPLFGVPRPLATPYSRMVTPSAGLISSAEDMAHYLLAHLNEGRYGEAAILTPQSMAQTHQAGAEVDFLYHYAMGWFVRPFWEIAQQQDQYYRVPILVSHDGAWQNFRSIVALIPERRLGVVALINTNDFQRESMYGQIGERLAVLTLGGEPAPLFAFEDAFTQNAKSIAIGLVALQVALLVWSLITIVRWRRLGRPRSLRRVLAALLLPLIVDVLLAVYVVFGVPVQFEAPLSVILGAGVDVALLLILSLIISVGWGSLRTILYGLTLRRTRLRAG